MPTFFMDDVLLVRNLVSITEDRKVSHLRKQPHDMNDGEVIAYINSRNMDEVIFDSWDLERDEFEESLSQPGPYRLYITGEGSLNNSEMIVRLFRCGFSRYSAHKFNILTKFFKRWVIASGELEFLEQIQQQLDSYKIRSIIRFNESL